MNRQYERPLYLQKLGIGQLRSWNEGINRRVAEDGDDANRFSVEGLIPETDDGSSLWEST